MCQSRPYLERKHLQIRPWQRRKQRPPALLTSAAPSCAAPQPRPQDCQPQGRPRGWPGLGPGAGWGPGSPLRLDARSLPGWARLPDGSALAPEFGNTEPETLSGNPRSRVGRQHSPVQAPPQAWGTGGQGLFLPTTVCTPCPSLASQPVGTLTGWGKPVLGKGVAKEQDMTE